MPASNLIGRLPIRGSGVASRRHILTCMVIAAAGGMVTVTACELPGVTEPAPAAGGLLDDSQPVVALTAADLAPRITSNEDFYVQSYRETPLVPDLDTWTLTISGLVSHDIRLGLDDILSLPAVEQQFTLACIGNPVGGQLIGNAVWVGTPLRPLLERAEIKSWAQRVAFHCLDDYVTSIPVEDALAPGVLLVYRMNGEPLPPDHGSPLRLLNPGHYGQKCPKWLSRIEVIARDEHRGTWEQEGWSDDASIGIMSRIDAPHRGQQVHRATLNVTGIALGGWAGTKKVEVSTDGGWTWHEALLGPTPSPHVWAMWTYRWQVPGPGTYMLVARATDGQDRTQPSTDEDDLDGQTGFHRVRVHASAP